MLDKLLGPNYEMEYPRLDIGNRRGWTDYIDFIRQNEVTEPIMWGIDIHGRPFAVIRFVGENKDGKDIHFMQTFFQRYTDSNLWHGCGHGGLELIDTCGGMSEIQFKHIREIVDGKVQGAVEKSNLESATNIRLARKGEWSLSQGEEE